MNKTQEYFSDLKANILIANGVKGIIINYDGSGDSGAIEEIVFVSNIEKETEYEGKVPDKMKDKIEQIGYEYIDKSGDIDFNNEGCYGRFVMDLEKMTIKKENNINITDTEYSEEEWKL